MTAVVVAMLCALLAACTSGPGDADHGTGATAEALGGDVIRLLADVGVGVYDDPAAAEPLVAAQEPVSPVRLLKAQADALAYQVEGGTGFTAAELDDLTPHGRAGQLDVTASKAIDGWAEHAATPPASGFKARMPRGCPGGATVGHGVYLIETQTDSEVGWGVPNAVGCIYARGATYPYAVWIAPARVTQLDAAGRLAFTVDGRRRSFMGEHGGFQPLDIGAEAAWVRPSAEAVDVVAVVGNRTLVVSAFPPNASRDRAVGVAERILGLRSWPAESGR